MSSWGYDRTEGITSFWNTTMLLEQLVSSVSCNGNLLLNIGATADGRIIPAFEERLLEMGAWLEVRAHAFIFCVYILTEEITEAILVHNCVL